MKNNKDIPFYKSPIIVIGISLFLLLVIATIYRIIIALETYPGLVVDDAYNKGKNYGRTIANREKIKLAGWVLDLELPKILQHNVKQQYIVQLNKEQQALESQQATLFFYRPADKNADFSIKMKEVENGIYKISTIVTLKGRWDVIAEVEKDGQIIQKGFEVFYK